MRSKKRGTQKIGVLVSGSAQRLRPEGITPLKPMQFDIEKWWLGKDGEVNSSQHLEVPATQFACQGLEVDWAIVGWDLSLIPGEQDWIYKLFSVNSWKDRTDQRYLLNSFRVVLTRARQGMVVFIPKGSPDDPTRNPKHYDAIYNYLKEVGIEDL